MHKKTYILFLVRQPFLPPLNYTNVFLYFTFCEEFWVQCFDCAAAGKQFQIINDTHEYFGNITEYNISEICHVTPPLEIFVKTHVLLYFYNETRSSHQRYSAKAVLENFAIFTKKLCWSPFLVKLQGFSPAVLLKRGSNTGVVLWILQNI